MWSPFRSTPPRHRRSSGRGRLTLTASALGLALALGGVAGARDLVDTPSSDRALVPRQVRLPFTVQRAVRFETVVPPGPSRTRPPRSRVRGVPERLVVARLGVDAPVVPLRAPRRVLLPPSDPRVLGWWRSGAVPGAARGSALITGHTVHTGGGAFDDLETLRRGDGVTVRTTGGSVRYVVTRVRIYRKATLASDAARVFSQSVRGRLVLVTCEDWNGTTYLSNAVVIAEPVR